LLGTAALALLLWHDTRQLGYLVLLLTFSSLALLGLSDLLQRKRAILRNYPIAAHLRFHLEKIRPEMRQYFFEDDKEGLPSYATSAPSSTSAPKRRGAASRNRQPPSLLPSAEWFVFNSKSSSALTGFDHQHRCLLKNAGARADARP
jgi:hypothetical protein